MMVGGWRRWNVLCFVVSNRLAQQVYHVVPRVCATVRIGHKHVPFTRLFSITRQHGIGNPTQYSMLSPSRLLLVHVPSRAEAPRKNTERISMKFAESIHYHEQIK